MPKGVLADPDGHGDGQVRRYRGPVVANEAALNALALLADPTRRALHAFVRTAREPVTRERAAAAVGVSRKLAAFHLDKLVRAGLLQTEPGRRAAPAVGRTPKVYRSAPEALTVAVPHRDYALLSDILADAVVSGTGSGGEPVEAVMLRVAGQRGVALGRACRRDARPGRLGPERALTLVDGALRRGGYEPYRESVGCLRLGNCPFHELAVKLPDLVCALNRAYLDGMLQGLEASALRTVPAPGPGRCCVEVRAAGEGA